MEHTYVQVDKDGTVECTECGLKNSDPTRNDFTSEYPCGSTIRIELLATIDEINQYLEGNVTKTGLQITLSELINKL